MSAALPVSVDGGPALPVRAAAPGPKGDPGAAGAAGPSLISGATAVAALPTVTPDYLIGYSVLGGTAGKVPPTAFDAAGAAAAAQAASLQKGQLLADLPDPATALDNLGGLAAVACLTDVPNKPVALVNLGVTPSNTAPTFTALTAQTPGALVASAGLTLTGPTGMTFTAVAGGGTNTEVSGDGGTTWGPWAGVPANVTGALKIRSIAPAYGYTDATPYADVAGVRVTWSVGSREFDPATDLNSLAAYLTPGAMFQHIDRTVVAGNFTEPCRYWGNASGYGYAAAVLPDETSSLDVQNVAPYGTILQGKNTVAFPVVGGVNPPAFTFLAKVRHLVLDTGFQFFFSPGWSDSAGFLSGDAGTGFAYTDDVLGTGFPGVVFTPRPTTAAWFVLGIKRTKVGRIYVTVNGGTNWTEVGTGLSGATKLALVFAPKFGTTAHPMVANQQAAYAAYATWEMTAATQTALEGVW